MPAQEKSIKQVLRDAAVAATAAPSIFNTQPWRWQADGTTLRLWADRERQLMVADPDGRLLTISCGVALHHARLALAASGHEVSAKRLPDPADPDLLATIELAGAHQPTAQQLRLHAAIARRRTDRRAFGPEPVPAEIAHELVDAAEAQGAHLHLVRRADIARLAFAAAQAAALQLADSDYRKELIRWTHRPTWSGDGVPTATAVQAAPRAVPVRDFAPFGGPSMSAGPQTDNGALYAVVFTDEDSPASWLRSGEALSAALLTATAHGLGTAPMSDVTELTVTRERLRHLLSDIGVPQLAVRIGHAPAGEPPPVPRRAHDQIIYP
ncbi:NAD(P)H nitroreductase [Rhizocola hellebori]|uniref:NAD(P)H nitroreductase n=1 Tax=Rhizocola hellebori TaxID=1392758 RepID=A0A8J3Q7R6_9ACTN|nr:nitroreductase family protein [Rhizocola hellebori]GIH04937.1 NAD(P)H nitroreductase [Rhizocola hellebori]